MSIVFTVANRHFGDLGDVWKHLALSALLRREQPEVYCESHAGSAFYSIAEAPQERQYDFREFLDVASSSPVLRRSLYAEELRRIVSTQERYPGSPWLAVSTLRRSARYVFVDRDKRSLETIGAAVRELDVPSTQVDLVPADGVRELTGRLLGQPPPDKAFAFIDPFTLHESSGATCLDLFERLAKAEVSVAVWFLFRERARAPSGVWRGLIDVGRANKAASGLQGCGLAVANVSELALNDCAQLGIALAEAFPGATFSVTWPSR